MIYIREAHALDGARPRGGSGNPLIEEPQTIEERTAVARTCSANLNLAPLKTLIDKMDNSTGEAYAGFPDRLFLVGKDGKLAFSGDRGPRGFIPEQLEDAIRVALGLPALEREESSNPRRRRF